jgi:hypothetical protein
VEDKDIRLQLLKAFVYSELSYSKLKFYSLHKLIPLLNQLELRMDDLLSDEEILIKSNALSFVDTHPVQKIISHERKMLKEREEDLQKYMGRICALFDQSESPMSLRELIENDVDVQALLSLYCNHLVQFTHYGFLPSNVDTKGEVRGYCYDPD